MLILSCQQNVPISEKTSDYIIQSVKIDSKELEAKNLQMNKEEIWIQYKKYSTLDPNDSIPRKNCHLILDSNVVRIYVNGILKEEHKLIRDNRYSFLSYYFEDKPDDILQYLDEDQSRLVIKRNFYDGVQEFYIKQTI